MPVSTLMRKAVTVARDPRSALHRVDGAVQRRLASAPPPRLLPTVDFSPDTSTPVLLALVARHDRALAARRGSGPHATEEPLSLRAYRRGRATAVRIGRRGVRAARSARARLGAQR